MKENAYLIIDIGTGNLRTCVVSAHGCVLCDRTQPTPIHADLKYPSANYFKPKEYWDIIRDQIRSLIKECSGRVALRAITATSIREGIVLLNRDGTAITGFPNGDNRGAEWISRIPNKEAIYHKCGHWVTTTFSATKLLGLKNREPERYGQIAKITSISDWIGYQFTGNLFYEHSQACETLLYDIEERSWSEQLCGIFDVSPDLLPPLVDAGTRIGTIRSDIAAELGIPPGTPYIVSGADTQMGVYGTGAVSGDMVIVSGTTSPVVRIHNGLFRDPDRRCWTDCFIHPGQYLVETNPGSTGINYQVLKSLMFSDVSYETMEQEYRKKTEIRCTALFSSVDFSRQMSFNKGCLILNNPLKSDLDRYDVGLALLADIACAIAKNVSGQLSLLPYDKKYIIACGGGMQSRLLTEMIASLTGFAVRVPVNFRQSSACGCARICTEALKEEKYIPPEAAKYQPAAMEPLKEAYVRWQQFRESDHLNHLLSV